MYYTQEQIDRANQADLVSFLQSQGEQLTRAGNEYRWKRHDSLTVRGNKWYRHSQSKGGAPVDFVMEFFSKSFTEAVEMLTGEKGAAPPPDRPSSAPLSDFRLPPRSPDNSTARNYLTATRRIDEDVSGFFFASGDIYEDAAHHNAVFVGRDEDGVPRYAHQRGTAGSFRLDVKGSDKAFNFCYRGEGERLFVFEAPIDLLSFLCLFKKDWQKQSYLALGGVGDKALMRFLSDRPNIKTVYLCLDSDQAGNDACSRLVELMPEGLTVHRLIPLFKDWNEVQTRRNEITDGKYLREAVYGLKEPPQEETVEIIRMSEVDTQTVEWLWKPYIPFGKVTIVQGNPGEGKTTFALRLAAACTTGGTLPGMKPMQPFQVIYQTAEDGLGDTVKPRLIEAAADLDRVLVIDEAKRELTLSDERIEKAIIQNGARLIILDPIQAYMGDKADMNKANEVRPIFRRLAEVAERTGCAVILIGHLNKAAGGQSAYRGLGSIDFRAAARSVLLIGRVKREPNVRVIIHDKSSLAPEGKPVAFCLDTINFKTRKHFKDKKSHYVPEDEWTIFENTHEAIIDQQTFDLVQKIRGNVRRYPDGWGEVAPLTGLLYCADCGGKMYVHRTNNGKRISQYTCSQYTKVPCGTLCKTQHRINEDVVLSLVSEMLKAIADYAKHDRAEFVRVVQEAQSSQQTAEVRKQRTRLATAKQRVSELEVLLCKIYEDNILGKLSDSRYATLDAQYEKEQSELTAEISVLEKAVKSYEKHEKDADRFIALIDKYENFDKLTIAMLNEFIEKILVHERDRKGSIQTTQEVEIYFNFVGRFVPPAFGEVELIPEELEEIRKREERKDRLHQNYLKRKASGAQKRYEDKIKKRKKAEIEAKKAAIRAEDIAKGVFVPVSSLPQREPMKGVQTA